MNRIQGIGGFAPTSTQSPEQNVATRSGISKVLMKPQVLAAIAAIGYTAYSKKTLLPLAAVPLIYGGAMAGFGNATGTAYAMWAAAAASVIYPWIKKK
jgi:hypothetical protein